MEPLLDQPVQLALELAGVFVFALSGGLLAVRKDFDVVGIGLLAFLTALGGGLIRDLIIGDTPPAAFHDTRYLIVSFVAAVVVFTWWRCGAAGAPQLHGAGRQTRDGPARDVPGDIADNRRCGQPRA